MKQKIRKTIHAAAKAYILQQKLAGNYDGLKYAHNWEDAETSKIYGHLLLVNLAMCKDPNEFVIRLDGAVIVTWGLLLPFLGDKMGFNEYRAEMMNDRRSTKVKKDRFYNSILETVEEEIEERRKK